MIAALQSRDWTDRDAAQRLVAAARESGVDGVKVVARDDAAPSGADDISVGDIAHLVEYAAGLEVLVAPYDLPTLERLSPLSFTGWKVDAPLLTHLPLLERFADDPRPVVAAIAGCTKPELDDALDRLPPDAVLMQTLLRADGGSIADVAHMSALKQYSHPIGYADRAAGTALALAAVALGAAMVEKPLRTGKRVEGFDQGEGLLLDEFGSFVARVRAIEQVLQGDGTRDPAPEELDVIELDRVVIVASQLIPRGTVLDRGMLTLAARGAGLPPRLLGFVEGRRALYDIPGGSLVTFGLIEL